MYQLYNYNIVIYLTFIRYKVYIKNVSNWCLWVIEKQIS